MVVNRLLFGLMLLLFICRDRVLFDDNQSKSISNHRRSLTLNPLPPLLAGDIAAPRGQHFDQRRRLAVHLVGRQRRRGRQQGRQARAVRRVLQEQPHYS